MSDSCNPMGCSPPGSSIQRISQARILEWVAISFSRGIFPTQGSNPHLLHWKRILIHWATRVLGFNYYLSHEIPHEEVIRAVDWFFLVLSPSGHQVSLHCWPSWSEVCPQAWLWPVQGESFQGHVPVPRLSSHIAQVERVPLQAPALSDCNGQSPLLCPLILQSRSEK